jgi:putative selenium metabolism protein SsnA
MSFLLRGAQVVTRLDPPQVTVTDLLVENGRIAAIRPELTADAATLDCRGCLVVPGNVCAHTHVYSALARGMPYRLEPPTTFLEILQRVWWRLDRALDEPSIRASALVAGREALLAGTTTLVDHHASPNAIDGSLHILAEALGELGIRSVLAYEVTDRDGPERARGGLDENRRFLRRVEDEWYPLSRGMVGAHASFTLSSETLDACVELARETSAPIHIHVAEDAVDEADAVARYDQRVVARLAAAGALSGGALLAHAVHLQPAEARMILEAGATVAHNPRSNMNNGVGRTPLGWLGDRVALGTDGIGADMFEEARVAYLRRREEELGTSPDWALARLARGARLAGRAFDEPMLGTLEPGAPADLVVLEPSPPTPLDAANLAGHWIFGLAGGSVRDVFVAGAPVVRNGRLTRVDDDELLAQARDEADRLWTRMGQIEPHPFTPSRLLATPLGGA